MPPYPWTIFEILKYYQSKPKSNGAYSRINLSKVNWYESIGTCWIALYLNTENVKCFDSFEVEHIPKK